MFYVYVLLSEKDKLLYTGYSDNLKSRYDAHANGFVKATRHRRPIKLIYYEAYINELDARRRELYLKGGNGKALLKNQLVETYKNLGYRYI